MKNYAIIINAFNEDLVIDRSIADQTDFIDCDTESVVFIQSPLTIEEFKAKYFNRKEKYTPCIY